MDRAKTCLLEYERFLLVFHLNLLDLKHFARSEDVLLMDHLRDVLLIGKSSLLHFDLEHYHQDHKQFQLETQLGRQIG